MGYVKSMIAPIRFKQVKQGRGSGSVTSLIAVNGYPFLMLQSLWFSELLFSMSETEKDHASSQRG
jgi:hypothetical protein